MKSSPRVNKKGKSDGKESPRVKATNSRVTIDEARSRYKVGTIISKKWDGVPYEGTIVKPFDGRHYHVLYEDGDEEDLSHREITKYLPKIKYSAGWGAALSAICRDATAMNAMALDSLREAQNVAFAVTHPETGK